MSNFLATVKQHLDPTNRFDSVEANGDSLRCKAKGAAAEAWYTIDREGDANTGGWAVSLLTPDRWLSESIEGDMLEGRDTAEELIDDELVELGFAGKAEQVKHYRDDNKVYVFRSRIPGVSAAAAAVHAQHAATYMLAFEAAFANLGDMQAEPST
ncbi:MAG: hypothetical protein JNK53_07730 [Phycisphaerae bacterium]|nr:hypothetical protein [Phycisphaerae bacterium]